MTMNQLGEKEYIRHIFSRYSGRQSFTAATDDAAIIELTGRPPSIALKIDRGPGAISYKFGLSGRVVDGRLAATACCSDLLAAWSRPRALMISVTVPPETEVADVDAALDGFLEICEENDVDFVGGDTKAGPWNLVACGVGDVDIAPVRRQAGRPGDVVVVCGEVGSFTAATLRAMKMDSSISLSDATDILCHPNACWRQAEWLRGLLMPSSATDASDGLYEALLNVASDGCGVRISQERLPFSGLARQVSLESSIPLNNFLYGGGDWNLAIAIPREKAESLGDLTTLEQMKISVVGEIVEEPGFTMSSTETGARKLRGIISDHFLGRIEDPVQYFERLRLYSGWDDS